MMPPMSDLYIGLMSGTSLDGVDGALVDFSGDRLQVLAHASTGLPEALHAELLSLNASGTDELHRAALAGHALARCYADVVAQLLSRAGVRAAAVQAVGAHGQTVRHRPQTFDGTGYTTQLNSPALLAELCGIDVVADFRSRDVAAGGQGAPLVPAFHQSLFGRPGQLLAVLNLGGMSNLSILPPDGRTLGLDCGPGNVLLDLWCQRHQGRAYDENGDWSASGQVLPGLLRAMLADPYFSAPAPKSTGRDHFHAGWLDAHLALAGTSDSANVQATLAELTARSCVAELQRHGGGAHELIVCGGGALNGDLMRRLQGLSGATQVVSSAQRGLPPMQVEAVAFAWLARRCVLRLSGNLPAVTGARGERVLGAVYPH
jgi:anhydro-N-acetylmuramic acid kinase